MSKPSFAVIKREGAIGDVIAASCVAEKVAKKGLRVVWKARKPCLVALKNHPFIGELEEEEGDCHVDLDNAYEKVLSEKRNFLEIFFRSTREQLLRLDVDIGPAINLAPKLYVTEEEKEIGWEKLRPYPEPWIFVVPKSNYFLSRTVQKESWSKASNMVDGTWFWAGVNPGPKKGRIIDLECKEIRDLMGMMTHAHVVASVDTGPLQIAAGLRRPIVAIEQAFDPRTRLSDQRDFSVIGEDLGCLDCREHYCKFNKNAPRCSFVDPEKIARAVEAKLNAQNGNSISAVIPSWKTNVERLNKCLTHVLNQVDEVVIGVDGDGAILPGIKGGQKVRFVQNTRGERMGFGRTMNSAIREASGRYLLFLNDDVYLDFSSVERLKKAMEPDVGVVGMQLWYPDGTLQHGGTFRTPDDLGWGHLDWKRKEPSIKHKKEVEFVTFASALVRREAFYEAGCFDERYDCYHEDSDLCLEVRRRGWKVMYEPRATGIHEESQTLSPIKEQMHLESEKKFRGKWSWYFLKNKHNNMGKFV